MYRDSSPTTFPFDRRKLLQGATVAGVLGISGISRSNAAALQDDLTENGGRIILPYAGYLAKTVIPNGGVTNGSGQAFIDPAIVVDQGLLTPEQFTRLRRARVAFFQSIINPAGEGWKRTDFTTIYGFQSEARANQAIGNLIDGGIPAGTVDLSDDSHFMYSFPADLGGVPGTSVSAFAASGNVIVNMQALFPTDQIDPGTIDGLKNEFLSVIEGYAQPFSDTTRLPLIFDFGGNPVDTIDIARFDSVDIPAFQRPPALDPLIAGSLADATDAYSHQGAIPDTDNYVFIDEYHFEDDSGAASFVENYPSEANAALQSANGLQLFPGGQPPVEDQQAFLVTWEQEQGTFGGFQSIRNEGNTVLLRTIFDTSQDVTGQAPDPNEIPWEDLISAPLTAEEEDAERFYRPWTYAFSKLSPASVEGEPDELEAEPSEEPAEENP